MGNKKVDANLFIQCEKCVEVCPYNAIKIPSHTVSLRELGIAMIHIVNTSYEQSILESKDIVKLANPAIPHE
jgi:ferredoxin